jgi:ferredoxin-NADP reductase
LLRKDIVNQATQPPIHGIPMIGVTRQYSLCNDPSEGHRYLIGVLRDPASRGGSKTMHESVADGDMLRISVPKNHFPLAHQAAHSLLLAGGIGVTPILCMAERLATAGASFEMHYCTLSRDRTAFHGRIAASLFASRVQFHFDDGPAEQKLEIQSLVAAPRPGVHLYVCGPKGFMEAILNTARAVGWPAEQLHYEFFSAGAISTAEDATFEVKLVSSGKIVLVAKDQDRGQSAHGSRHRGPYLLRAGCVRHLPYPRARRRAGSQGRVSDARGAGKKRPVPALLLPREVTLAGTRSLAGVCRAEFIRPRRANKFAPTQTVALVKGS